MGGSKLKEIFNRRSIRKYENRPVEKEKIDKILRAGMQAPSAINQQAWEFIVVENKETLKKLAEMSPYSKLVEGSAVTFVLLGNSDNMKASSAWEQDLSAVAQNMLLESTHLNLGSVWIGVSVDDSRVSYIKELFVLPDNIKPFALIALGYPDNQKNEFVDRYNQEKVHYENWK